MANLNQGQTKELQIDLLDVIRGLIKDCWMILLVGLSAGMVTYVVANLVYKPSYSTSTTFAVTSKGYNDTYDNLIAASSIASSFTDIFDSDILKKKVAADIGTKELPDYISAEVIPETNLFVLTVSAPNPMLSYRVMESIIKNYTLVTDYVYKNAILDVLQASKIPEYPDNYPSVNDIINIGFYVGIVAMGGFLALLSIMRDNIKNEKEIPQKLDTKLFATVYHEKKYKTLRSRIRKRKKSILMNSPTVSFTFVECFRKMRVKLEYKATQRKLKVILVTSVLENEGKSTVATNLAIALADKFKKVILVDGDFKKPSIHKILQKELTKEPKENNNESKYVLTSDENTGLSLILGSEAETDIREFAEREEFRKRLEDLKHDVDYIIIDAPPISVSVDAEILADYADASLLVVKQSTARTRDINDAIDILNNSNAKLLGCIYNNVIKLTFLHRFIYGNKYEFKGYYEYSTKASF